MRLKKAPRKRSYSEASELPSKAGRRHLGSEKRNPRIKPFKSHDCLTEEEEFNFFLTILFGTGK